MYSIISTLVLLLAATATAIQITFPTKDAEISMNDGVTVRWTSVNTDPSTFAVHLVNNNVFPPVDHMVANSVQTSDGSFTIRGMSGVKNGNGYQINFVSTDPQNTGILAQSQQFNVRGESTSLSASSSSSSSSTSGSTSSNTVPMSMLSASSLGSSTASPSALRPSGTSPVNGTSSTASSSTASATGARTSTGGAVMLGASTMMVAGSVALGLASVFA